MEKITIGEKKISQMDGIAILCIRVCLVLCLIICLLDFFLELIRPTIMPIGPQFNNLVIYRLISIFIVNLIILPVSFFLTNRVTKLIWIVISVVVILFTLSPSPILDFFLIYVFLL